MMVLAVFCALGLPAGFLLLWRTPLCSPGKPFNPAPVSIVIPARNEEHNLPQLLNSIHFNQAASEVLVVDDDSTDRTALIAESLGARVIPAPPLPAGWTGKTWACHQGAQAARNPLLLFLDADTWFEHHRPDRLDGLTRLITCIDTTGPTAASILPFHVMQRPYEQLSLFFNLLMAIGAGGFGAIGTPRLFGQSLLISRSLYQQTGGHAAVRKHILENLALASRVREAGGTCVCLCGRGTLSVRMFPDGLAQLCEGWTKAFADGAAASDPLVLLISVFWLTALCSTFLLLFFASTPWRLVFAAFYLAFAVQLMILARRLGSYHQLTCLLYPLPLLFYFGIFGQSLYRRAFRLKVRWRGRRI